MFDVLYALFGGIFLLGRYTYDKIKTDCARADYNTLKNRRELLTFKYGAGTDLCNQIKEYIFCGEHFEDICNSLADDLKYVFGSDWKNKLDIPNGYRVNYSALYPSMHEYWIYHLLLAKRGKFDMWITHFGLELGYNLDEAKTNVKFAECIEGRLLNAGVEDVKLALECELLCAPDNYRLPTHLCGGKIKIQSICIYPTHRLWEDYKKIS